MNKDNIFEMGAEVKVRWFLGTQVSPDNRYFAAAHDETGNSFFKIVDVENREVIFESNIYNVPNINVSQKIWEIQNSGFN